MSLADVTVGIDIGTTSVKAVAVGADGTILDRVRIPHRLHVRGPDHVEHDARRVWARAPRRALAVLAATRPRAVAVAAFAPSLTAVDRTGRPVAPGLLYGDARGRDAEGETLGFLRWLAAAVPGASGFWPAPAVANRALGGRAVIDIGTAFASAPLYGSTGWDGTHLAACGLEASALPDVELMGAPVGTVTGTDAVLGGGSVDGLCEQLVSGVTEVGDVLVVCGTTLLTWIVVAEPLAVPGLWTIPHTTPGRWLVGGASNAGGLFLAWADSALARRGGDDVAPGAVPVWLPYIRGERTPLNDTARRASLHGADLTHGAGALRRAAYEASAFVVRHHLDLAGVEPRRVHATGGGTRLAGWMQALADVLRRPVDVAAAPEGAALGAAWLARMALGAAEGFEAAAAWARLDRSVDPDPRWTESADERYRRFRALTDAEGRQ